MYGNQKGLIFTNDKCIGCNKCISACPVIVANRAVKTESGIQRIEVDGDKCIACGACFDACEHNAREFVDDTEAFFEALSGGEKISVLWAPAFAANYPNEYRQILGGLKKLGVNRIISVSFGADITTWGYIKYITEHNFQSCSCQLYRTLHTGTDTKACADTEPADVCCGLCKKISEHRG